LQQVSFPAWTTIAFYIFSPPVALLNVDVRPAGEAALGTSSDKVHPHSPPGDRRDSQNL